MKPLSEQLRKLSDQVKVAENRVAEAQTELREDLDKTRQKVTQETEQALGKLQQRFDASQADARDHLQALRAKVAGDFDQIRDRAAVAKDKLESWQADNYAADLEADAIAAVDYAIVATKMAELQVLDALAARQRADAKAGQVEPTTA